jgi:hypothetical protein
MIETLFALWFAMLCRAQCEEMWYHNEATRLWNILKHSAALSRWYKGHISLIQAFWPKCPSWLRYNPAWPLPLSPFLDDCWHFFKKLEFASLSAAFALITENVWLGVTTYVLLGVFFYINFHTIIPARYKGSWRPWSWLIAFWKPR